MTRNDDQSVVDPASGRSWRVLGVAGCGMVFLGLLVAVALYVVMNRQRLPELSREAFEDALARWNARGPKDYDMEVRVDGPQPGLYAVAVRGGVVQSASRNGQPLTQRRTMGTWTVPGMFTTIERDLIRVEDYASGRSATDPRLLLRASFHPQYGYPERYHRVQWGASPMDVYWQVTHFDPTATNVVHSPAP